MKMFIPNVDPRPAGFHGIGLLDMAALLAVAVLLAVVFVGAATGP